MEGYSISETAQRSGFPATTLRFYEESGLVRPARTSTGYRVYTDDHLELLSFIGRAKRLGLSLGEITELLTLLDQEQCAPVKDHLRGLLETRLSDTQDKIAELVAHAAQLQEVKATLGGHTPDGPCDRACGCTTDETGDGSTVVQFGRDRDSSTEQQLVCTLAPDRIGERLSDWQAILSHRTARESIPQGMRVRFSRDVDVVGLSELIVAEQDCCQFFTFGLQVDATEVVLDVTGEDHAQPVINALVG